MKEPNIPGDFNYSGKPETDAFPFENATCDDVLSESVVYPLENEDMVFDFSDPEMGTSISAEELLHDDLTEPETRDELMAADHAMYSAGLQHPEDAETPSDLILLIPEESLSLIFR